MLIREFGDPVFYALHHLALNLGVTVMEIWVESVDTSDTNPTEKILNIQAL